MTFYITPMSATSFDMFPEDDFFFSPMKRQRTSCCVPRPNPFDELAALTSFALPQQQQRRRRAHPVCRWRIPVRREGVAEDFTAAVPVRGFRPEEVTMDVDKETRTVKVVGTSEQKSEDGAVVSKRHFERSFRLPETCDMEALTVKKTEGGVLKISAPAVNKAIEDKKTENKKKTEEKRTEKKKTEDEKTEEDKTAEAEMDVETGSDEAEQEASDSLETGSDEAEQEASDSLFDAEVTSTEVAFSIAVNVGPKIQPGDLSLEVDPKTRELSVKAKDNVRTFVVPEAFDLDKMSSALSQEDGTLLVKALPKEEKRSIPINISAA